tara:strand:- start:1446 stop:1862 length:417 start_codon:yes stop_codon:yes gene_type:complete
MNPFFLIFICLPVFEIYLLIEVGGQVGALNTIALILFTAIIGLYFAKHQGIQTLKDGMMNLYQNKIPIFEMMSGASIALAAFLLVVPGFLTDFIGFLILVPFTRKIFFKLALRNKTKKNKSQNKTIDGEIIENNKDEL